MPQKWGRDVKVKVLGAEVAFRLSGDQTDDTYVKNLRGMVERGGNMKPAMEKILEYIQGSTARTFEAEGRPNKWQALAQSTIEDRLEAGYGAGPILVRTGRLRDSLTKKTPDSIAEATARTVKYGSKVPYFNTHQRGTNEIPQRIMVVLQKQDRAQVGRIINKWVREGKV